jgi:hypothetical protein
MGSRILYQERDIEGEVRGEKEKGGEMGRERKKETIKQRQGTF